MVINGYRGAQAKSDSEESESESEELKLGRPQPIDCASVFLLMYVQKGHTKTLCLN